MVLQGSRRIGGRGGRPQRVERGVDRHDVAAVEHEQREQASLQDAGRGDVAPGCVLHAQWAEHVDLPATPSDHRTILDGAAGADHGAA